MHEKDFRPKYKKMMVKRSEAIIRAWPIPINLKISWQRIQNLCQAQDTLFMLKKKLCTYSLKQFVYLAEEHNKEPAMWWKINYGQCQWWMWLTTAKYKIWLMTLTIHGSVWVFDRVHLFDCIVLAYWQNSAVSLFRNRAEPTAIGWLYQCEDFFESAIICNWVFSWLIHLNNCCMIWIV